MDFDNDPVKAAISLKTHKVSLEEAASVFGDPLAYIFADPHDSIGEERWLMFGIPRMARVLAVIFTHRRGKYRIISARLVTRHERKTYEEG
jgi:uncharacterized DUF497 family protein